MKLKLLNHITVLLDSGIPLGQVVIILKQLYPSHSVVNYLIQIYDNNHGIGKMISYLFPWWCRFPYQNDFLPPNTPNFVKACKDYIDHRLILINLFLKSLTYPFFLFLFTIILFFIVSEMVPSLFLTTPSYQGFTYLIFFGVFMGVAILLLFAFNAVRFGVFDLLVLIQLSLSQGMSLDVICSSLLFTGRIQKQWARLSFLIVHERSFVDGFVQLFSLPIVVEEILRMHQVSGRLLSGLNVVLPIHKSLIMNRVARLGYIFKGLIYCCIVVFILIIMSTLYQPMTNLNM